MKRLAAALLLAALLPPALAQQEIKDEAPAAGGAAADGPPPPADVAHAALPAALATRARLLDLAQAGSRLVALGEQGVIVVSDDGSQWRQVAAPVSVMLTRLHFLDDKQGWAVGYDATILHTADGGLTWTLQHRDPKARALFDVLFIDAQNGIAVGGYGSYYKTADGGKNWEAQNTPLTEIGQHFNRLLRLEDGTLFMAGERGMLARSADGGGTWEMLKSPYVGTFFGVLPMGGKRVLAYGMRGNIYVADDISKCPAQDPAKFDAYAAESLTDAAQIAALGWRKVEAPSRESLFGGTVTSKGGALLVGFNGIVYSGDAELTKLEPIRTQAEQTLVDIQIYKDRMIAVGKLGVQELRRMP